ncbi:MAG TPA: two-component regulator propeller domain-containing protein, partial [Bacteroidia bacterium]|nr:two-component regulator propeller domain-containing protein [Bacteroidia bacterium]
MFDRISRCALFFFFLFITGRAFAQQPAFKNFGVKDGLPSSEVYSAMQDSKGYMWFCTDNGISRYDGYAFKNFSLENGLPDNTVFGSYEDRRGRIWFRTLSGRLFYFNNDTIYQLPSNNQAATLMHNAILTSIYVDEGDTVWCGLTSSKGYFKIAPPYLNQDFTYHFLDHNSAYIFNIDKEGFVWGTVVDYPSGPPAVIGKSIIMRYSKNGRTDSLTAPRKIMTNSTIHAMPDGKYFVTSENEISVTGPGAFVSRKTNVNPLSSFIDSHNRIWAGLHKKGVFCYPAGDLNKNESAHYLDGLSVSSTTCDKEGAYWFTTLENGVYYMSSGDLLYYDTRDGFLANKVLTVFPRDSSSVWAGTADGSIEIVERNKLIHFKEPAGPAAENAIYRLQEGPGKTLLVGAVTSYI